jgi:hypothetical protein
LKAISTDLVRVCLCLGGGVLLLAALGRYAYYAIVFTEQLARVAAGALFAVPSVGRAFAPARAEPKSRDGPEDETGEASSSGEPECKHCFAQIFTMDGVDVRVARFEPCRIEQSREVVSFRLGSSRRVRKTALKYSHELVRSRS